MKTISKTKKIVLGLFSTALLLLLIEGTLRLFGFSFSVPRLEWGAKWGVAEDPTLAWSWLPVPGAMCNLLHHSFRFNEMGFRGPLFQKTKPPGTIRIVCMGDSVTMGWWVSDDKTYCYQLQQILSAQGSQKVETINAGVMAFTSYQGLHYLQTKILDLKPDIITISYNWNDHSPANKGIQDKNLSAGDILSGRFSFLQHLRLFQLAQFTVSGFQHRDSTKTQDLSESLSEDTAGPIRVLPDDYRRNLEKIIETAKNNGIVPILLTEPCGSEFRFKGLESDLQHSGRRQHALNFQYNTAVKKLAKEKGVICVDLVPVYREKQPRFWDSIHPAAGGHLLIAAELAQVIRNLRKS
jgi:lysophospholipase L1-like esterase